MSRPARAMVATAGVVLLMTGVAWASGITLASAHLGAGAVSTPAMFPAWLSFTNKSGNGTVGKVQAGDSVTFAWPQPIDETTLCSGWSNSSSSQSLTLQWSVVNGASGADDTLQVTGSSLTCATGFHIGVVDLGSAGYDTGSTSIAFASSTTALSVAATSTTLTVTLGSQTTGTASVVSSGNAAVWTPDAALKDRSGRNCGSDLAQSSTTVQF